MESIAFSGVEVARIEQLRLVFEFLARGKRHKHIDEAQLAKMLGPLHETRFIHTKEESDKWLAKWRADPDIEMPWDFGSWVDAILNAELDLVNIFIEEEGTGRILFNQFAWPTGGIGALEELVRVFGGQVVSNDAI